MMEIKKNSTTWANVHGKVIRDVGVKKKKMCEKGEMTTPRSLESKKKRGGRGGGEKWGKR